MASEPLATDRTPRVVGTTPVELVDRDHVGEVEHLNLLQLGSGTELGGHDVERDIGNVGHGGVALTDPGGLEDNEVVVRRSTGLDYIRYEERDLGTATSGGHRAKEDLWRLDGVHPYTVAKECSAGATLGRVGRKHGDAQTVALVEAEPSYQLVDERGLPGTTRAGDADDGRRVGPGRRCEAATQVLVETALLHAGDHAGKAPHVAEQHVLQALVMMGGEVDVALLDQHVDHLLQTEALAIGR